MCYINTDVDHNIHSNNCSLLYFGRFLNENILSINLKVHFLRWHVGYCGILPVMNRSILMYYLKITSSIQLKNQSISCATENSPKMKEEKFVLFQLFSVGASGLYRSRECRVYLWLLSVETKQKWFLHNLKYMYMIL